MTACRSGSGCRSRHGRPRGGARPSTRRRTGTPTANPRAKHRARNTALAGVPVGVWLPFESYRTSHLIHHRDERLTDPLDDPESRYWTPDGWKELGPIGQWLVALQTTLLGRLVIGPFWSMGRFWMDEFRTIRAGNRAALAVWGWHA